MNLREQYEKETGEKCYGGDCDDGKCAKYLLWLESRCGERGEGTEGTEGTDRIELGVKCSVCKHVFKIQIHSSRIRIWAEELNIDINNNPLARAFGAR
jgi:hypothetical protein